MKHEVKHITVRVFGNVQGVFFRKTIAKKARGLNLNGYVQNIGNKKVLIEAEGTEDRLEKLVKACWEGSAMSYVRGVRTHEGPVVGYRGFEIR